MLLHHNHSWERQVGAGEIHCRCKDWEKAKQTCSSSTTFEIVAVSEKSKLSDDADAARHHQIMGEVAVVYNPQCEGEVPSNWPRR